MEDVEVQYIEKPKLKNTILIEGLPGIGLVGKLAADHMLDELKAKKFAELYSPYLPPQVIIKEDGTIKLVNNELFYWKGKKNDLILLLGDFQGITPDSQYRLSEKAIEVAQEFNLKRIITLGGLGTGEIAHTPKVFGAATDKKQVEELKKYGVVFRGGGAIFGAAGLLLGIGKIKNVPAACLMGETHGQVIDAKSAESVLKVLSQILGIKLEMKEINKKARETEEQLSKMSKALTEQKKAMERQQEFLEETPSYIR
jgi:uncharacterized protein